MDEARHGTTRLVVAGQGQVGSGKAWCGTARAAMLWQVAVRFGQVRQGSVGRAKAILRRKENERRTEGTECSIKRWGKRNRMRVSLHGKCDGRRHFPVAVS